jgi:hypothetical protein
MGFGVVSTRELHSAAIPATSHRFGFYLMESRVGSTPHGAGRTGRLIVMA